MTTLMVVVVAAFLGVAYWEVRVNLRRTAAAQMRAAADQVALLLAQSTQQRAADLDRLASRDEFRQLVAHPGDAQRDAVRARLAALPSPNPQVAEVWSAGGVRLLTVASAGADVMAPGSAPTAAAIGALQQHD